MDDDDGGGGGIGGFSIYVFLKLVQHEYSDEYVVYNSIYVHIYI